MKFYKNTEKEITNQSVENQKYISFRCDTNLLTKVINHLTSQKLAGNYQHPNLSAIIRQALTDYQAKKLSLTYKRPINNNKKQVGLRVNENTYNAYEELPLGSRTELLERILGSWLENY